MPIFTALFLDALFGDPQYLPHPVAGIGMAVRFWERLFYSRSDKKFGGVIFCLAVLSTVGAAVAAALAIASVDSRLYAVVVAYLLYAALAWRSLKDHSLPVATALFRDDTAGARAALSRIVGRDTQNLEEEGIVKATVETVGENFVDGVFSVLFFAALGGLFWGKAGMAVAVWLFKASSTLDSMVGYDDERYRDFGCASARLDDLLNFIPARLGGLVVLLAGACAGYPFLRGMRVFLRDRRKHKSPNSAHGESAFAGLLGIQLGGGASYGGVFESKPLLGDPLRKPVPEDILRAAGLLDASVALSALCCAAVFVLWR